MLSLVHGTRSAGAPQDVELGVHRTASVLDPEAGRGLVAHVVPRTFPLLSQKALGDCVVVRRGSVKRVRVEAQNTVVLTRYSTNGVGKSRLCSVPSLFRSRRPVLAPGPVD